jgi:3-methyladenine DNA glycosylase/8-oxoguanine DNA glycosylase
MASLVVVMEVRLELQPRWPYHLPSHSDPNGVQRVQAGVLRRLITVDGDVVLVRAAQIEGGKVLLGAQARCRSSANKALERMRFALAVDDDLEPFYRRFRSDRLIGSSLRASPGLRVRRQTQPFEALAWAITEQLVDFPRAVEIQRRIIKRFGRWHDCHQLWQPPCEQMLAAAAPAQLEACDLSPSRSLALVRCARAVAARRIDLEAEDPKPGWQRLLRIPEIGQWTVESLALYGQGRLDQIPAGDLNYRKLVGRLRTGNPHVRASETEVRTFFARYKPFAGLAAVHLGNAMRRRRAQL